MTTKPPDSAAREQAETIRVLKEALQEALEYQNEDIDCLLLGESSGLWACPDNRCCNNGCMVARVNRWRRALSAAEPHSQEQKAHE